MKPYAIGMIFLGAIILLVVIVTAQAEPSGGTPLPVTTTSPSLPSGVPPAGAVLVGDKLGAFTVTSVPFSGVEEYEILLSGEATVSGRFYGQVYDGTSGDLCFEAASGSASVIPRLPGDDRKPWFCFFNQDEARRLLGDFSGEATIVVKDYALRFRAKESADTATLVRVLSVDDR